MPRAEPRVVVLAAGASSRLGEPKALVDLGGRSALSRLVEACGAAEPPLVVTGAHATAIARAAAALGPRACELVVNPRWAEGRTGGLALAASRLPGRDLVVAPIDVPLVSRSVFARLRSAWAEADAPSRGWLAPRAPAPAGDPRRARAGHPVVLGRDLAAALARMGPDEPLRDLRADAEPLWTIAVDDRAIYDDLDTPDDLARLRARLAAP